MIRSIASIVVGFITWTVLWLGGNAAVRATSPGAFDENLVTSVIGLLILTLGLSLTCSITAGALVAWIASRRRVIHAITLGSLLLAVGVAVQLQYWNAMPLWYHLSFLILLVPASAAGAGLQRAWA